jgi:hypothetical protein
VGVVRTDIEEQRSILLPMQCEIKKAWRFISISHVQLMVMRITVTDLPFIFTESGLK